MPVASEVVDRWSASPPAALVRAGLDGFEVLWDLDLPLIEAPNEERGGRSGVALLDLGADARYFLKRQEGHLTRSTRPPFRRIPTVEREWAALRRLAAAGIPAARPLFFGRRGGRAILLTEELRALGPLDAVAAGLGGRARLEIARALGSAVAGFHDLGLRHGALYPKHLLVTAIDPPAFGFIDLEKSRPAFPLERYRRHDLDALNRRSAAFGSGERLAFLRAYCRGREERLPRLWRALAARARARGMRG